MNAPFHPVSHTWAVLDAAPVCASVWNSEGRSEDCNDAALRYFGLASKRDWLDHHAELSPERQPDGEASGPLFLAYLRKAFNEGRAEFAWQYRRLDGRILRSQITLARFGEGDSEQVVAYAVEQSGALVADAAPAVDDVREQTRLQDEKRTAQERAQIMLDATPLGCVFWDEQSRLVDCNEAVVRLFGLKSKREFLDNHSSFSAVRQPDGQLSAELIPRYVQQAHKEGYMRFDWMHRKPDGEMLPTEITLVRVQRAEGYVVAAYIRDLRELLEVLRRIHEANEYAQLMLDATPLSCNLWNEELQMIACNQEAVNLLGLGSKQEYLDRYYELLPELQPCGRATRELAREYLDTAFREGRARFEWMHQKLDGESVPVETTLVRIPHGDGYIVAGYKRDLRELKESVASLKRLEGLAYTDKLTGVSNRHYFMEHAADELGKLSPGGSASLLILDIDHFKRVNDTYGHSAGDAILRSVAKRVRNTLRPDGLFARYGGEEFVILLARAPLNAALALAERVREVIAREPFEYQGQIIKVTISIGVAMSGHPALPLQDLIDQADAALYQAKHLGRNRVERFRPAEETARAS
ncbi:MAG TPA: diguanylate cyclase [Rhodocyclaceae bacterium]|nr:diguanylate cyclase [Rhodocyclaceae bacterium]